jgi:hypothetical protein
VLSDQSTCTCDVCCLSRSRLLPEFRPRSSLELHCTVLHLIVVSSLSLTITSWSPSIAVASYTPHQLLFSITHHSASPSPSESPSQQVRLQSRELVRPSTAHLSVARIIAQLLQHDWQYIGDNRIVVFAPASVIERSQIIQRPHQAVLAPHEHLSTWSRYEEPAPRHFTNTQYTVTNSWLL